jgi:hypothetical protein
LYIAVRVQTDTLHVPDPQSWVTGDQILLMIDQTRNRASTWAEPTDLMVLVRPPAGDAQHVLTASLYLTPFSQRGISDITMRTISSFFSHFVGEVHPSLQAMSNGIRVAGQRTGNGYTQEIAIPVGSQSEINLAISVNDAVRRGNGLRSVNFMLQERPYIGNAQTWVPVVLR